MKILILAGGGGTRLWPLSRPRWPKQFLSLSPNRHGASLLSNTIQRVAQHEQALQDIFIVTAANLYDQVQQDVQASGFSSLVNNIVCEPFRKNTAPAIALAAQYVLEFSKASRDEVLVILPSDHHIADDQRFYAHLQEAEQLAAQGYIVTLGVPPTYPETGFGYIEVNDAFTDASWLPVKQFVEKPDAATASRYVESHRFLWNAGIFVLTIGTLMDALAQHAPEIYHVMASGYASAVLNFDKLPTISFDYAVMEHAEQVSVVPMQTGWSDLGSWDSLYDAASKNAQGNVTIGAEAVCVDTRNTLTWNQSGRTIALLGLEDCLVVDTPDALLISRRGHSQGTRYVVDYLEQQPSALSLQAPAISYYVWGQAIQLNCVQASSQSILPVYQLTFTPSQTLLLDYLAETKSVTLLQGELWAGSRLMPVAKGASISTLHSARVGVEVGVSGAIILVVGELPEILPLTSLLEFSQTSASELAPRVLESALV